MNLLRAAAAASMLKICNGVCLELELEYPRVDRCNDVDARKMLFD
jgi:hypothetical protein